MGGISDLIATATPTPNRVPISDGSGLLDDWISPFVRQGLIVDSGLTMATNRILGRSTSGTGSIEEIQIGTGLTLSAGVLSASGGSGDVVGPASATDNSIVRFDGTTGKLIQNSGIIIDDTNNVSGILTLQASRIGLGITPDTTSPLFLKQANNSFTGGFRTIRSDNSNYGTWYLGGDDNQYFDLRTLGSHEFYINASFAASLSSTAYRLPASYYINFGTTVGSGGYGFRDNAGTMEFKNSGGAWASFSGGSGDVVGPASSTDNALARFDGTTGKLIQNSLAILDDNGALKVIRLGVGIDPDATIPVLIKQASNSHLGSQRMIRSDNSNYIAWYIGGDDNGYFDNRASGGGWEFYGNAATRLGGFTGAGAFDAVGKVSTLVGVGIRDTSAAFDVTIGATSSTTLTAGRALTLDVTNAARTIKLTGNPTLADWFDQALKTTSAPTFARVITTGGPGTSNVETASLLAGSTTDGNLLWVAIGQESVDKKVGLFGFQLGTSGSSYTDSFISIWNRGDSQTNGIVVKVGGTIRMGAYGAGTATFDSSGNVTSVSDARAKNTLGDFSVGLSAVRLLRPKKFTWKPESGLNTDDVNVSIYAQDLISAGVREAVFTERTEEVRDENLSPKRDENGKPIMRRTPAPYYTVSDRAVIAVLVNAIKDLDALNASLERRILAVEALANQGLRPR